MPQLPNLTAPATRAGQKSTPSSTVFAPAPGSDRPTQDTGWSDSTVGETPGAAEKIDILTQRASISHKHKIDRLEKALKAARQHPLRELKRKVEFAALRRISRWRVLPDRTRNRLARSAAKRNPDRGAEYDLPFTSYDDIVAAWARERKKATPDIAARVRALADGPVISVIVPVFDPGSVFLNAMVASIRAQSCGNRDIVIACEQRHAALISRRLDLASATDLKLVSATAHGDVWDAVNAALLAASGQFATVMRQDDALHPDALLSIAETAARHPEAKIIYCDDDSIDAEGRRSDPRFKPDWNRELFYSADYISSLRVFSADVLRKTNGIRKGYEGAELYDLTLRALLGLADEEIVHVPEVLYHHRRSAPTDTAANGGPDLATRSGIKALHDYLRQVSGRNVPVEAGRFPETFRPRWDTVSTQPKATLIMPMRDAWQVSKTAVDSILARTDYPDYEIVIVDNGSVEADTLHWLDDIGRHPQVRVLRDDGPFNYSALNNRAVARTDAEIIGLINNDIEVIDATWLAEMVGLAMRPDTGCVGAKLYYPDSRIQHAGVVIGFGGVAGHVHQMLDYDHPGYQNRLWLRQEYSAVTAACLVIRREVFLAVGGLNEADLKVAFNDIDLCLKVRAAGFRNVWTPYAELLHHESFSRGRDDPVKNRARFKKEADYIQRVWGSKTWCDPAFNKNLSLHHASFVPRHPSEMRA